MIRRNAISDSDTGTGQGTVNHKRHELAHGVCLVARVAVTALFKAVAWPFFKRIVHGALLAGMFNPLYLRKSV